MTRTQAVTPSRMWTTYNTPTQSGSTLLEIAEYYVIKQMMEKCPGEINWRIAALFEDKWNG